MAKSKGAAKGKTAPQLTNGKTNEHKDISRRKRPMAIAATWRSFLIQNVLRLFTWYAIATVLFRCPSTMDDCDDRLPAICKTYFQAKSAAAPHVEPYYDAYVAPYAEIASPYVNALNEKVVTPTRAFVVHYSAPILAQAQAYGQTQWAETGKPLVEKVQGTVKEQYQSSLGPYVDNAADVMSPFTDLARTSALQTYYEFVLPSYRFVKPYAMEMYDAGRTFTTDVAIPSTSWALSRTYMFLDDNVLPHIRALYVENVEPQLVRIGERLGRYKGTPSGSPKKSAATSRDSESETPTSASTFKKPSQPAKPSTKKTGKGKKLKNLFSTETSSDTSTSTSTSISATASADDISNADVESADKPQKLSREEIIRIAQETIAEDLKLWQTKFTDAADQGAAEIENKMDEIAKTFRESHVEKEGPKLLSDFEQVAQNELEKLKSTIITLVDSMTDDVGATADEVLAAIRRTGLAIKGKAEKIRNWREEFEQEIQAEVTGAVQQHFNILGGIRDLALQKIGMKWAWMDGVTYKDWAKFHELKKRFDEWTKDLQQLIINHPGLEAAMDAAAEFEDQAMEIAQSAAMELGRLKEVAGYKMQAGDTTDNFDTDAMRQAAEEAVEPEDEDDDDAESDSDNAEPKQETVIEPGSDSESDVPVSREMEPEEVEDEATNPAKEVVEDVVKDVLPSAIDAAPAVAEEVVSIDESSPPAHAESVIGMDQSQIIDSLPEVVDNITDAKNAPGDAPPVANAKEQIQEAEIAEEPMKQGSSDAPDDVAASVKPVFMGAMAQFVPRRDPIMDDDEDQDVMVATATSFIQSAYSDSISRASVQFSIAMSVVSAQMTSTPQPVHEQMFSSVSSSYTSVLAAASSRMDEAMDSVQNGALQKEAEADAPAIDWNAIESMAGMKLEEGRIWAEQQFESAKIVLGLATPTPTPVPSSEKLLEQARMNYYAGLGYAHARYSEFLFAASSAMHSLTATPTPTPTNVAESASSVASIVNESMASVAGEAGNIVGDAASSASSMASVASASVNKAYEDAADNLAQSWEVVVSHISVQVYGVPTPTSWYENLYSVADSYRSPAFDTLSVTNAAASYASPATGAAMEQYSAVSSIVSELILGKDAPFTESVLSRLNAAYSTATASAASAASAASLAASAASEGIKEKAEQFRDEL